MKAEPLDEALHVRITKADAKAIEDLAKRKEWSKGHIVRRILQAGLKALEKEIDR